MTLPTDSPAPDPSDRPRSVTAAFWCWLVAAVLLASLGLLLLAEPITVSRVIGGILLVDGLALALLDGRARKGDPRFLRAAVALAMATVIFLALVLLLGAVFLFVIAIAITMGLLITGAVLNRKPASQAWYSGVAR